MKIRVVYFGILQEQSGKTEEIVETECSNASNLYHSLATQYQMGLTPMQVQFAVNGKLGDQTLKDLDQVDFLPPFVGG